ncbi:nucleosome-remodeling factor subunit NURF301-like protein, partial [Dinothrombium tinctorium]
IQTNKGIKRIFTSKTPVLQQQQQQEGFAMIRTAAGQTFKVALSALQGKTSGQTIVIKTGGGNIVSSTTTATIISTVTPPVVTSPQVNPTRPTILQQPQQSVTTNANSGTTAQKIQIIKPIATSGSAAPTPTQQIVKTAPNSSSAQIPIRLPDGRIQILQIPISMLNSSTPIQIAIPQQPQQQQATTTQQKIITTPIIQPTTATTQQTQQVRIISNITPSTSNAQQQPVTRIIQFKQPQQQQTIVTGTVAATTSTPQQQVIVQQIAQQIKQGTIQIRLNPQQQTTVIASPLKPLAATTTTTTTTSTTPATSSAISSLAITTTTSPVTPPTTSNSSSSSFVITPQITSEIVRQAIINTQATPELQQKLLALQKQQQKRLQVTTSVTNVTTTVAVTTAQAIATSKQSTTTTAATTIITTPHIGSGGIKRMKSGSVSQSVTHLVESTPPEKREEMMRNAICGQVLKSILDKIERDERQEVKAKKKREQQKLNRWKQIKQRQQAQLVRNVDALKREIIRKRSELENKLRKEIEQELKAKEAKLQASKQHQTSKVKVKNVQNQLQQQALKRKSESEQQHQQLQQQQTSNTQPAKKKKLYCLCQTAYDCSRFMVGCDQCHNWFHCDCLGLDEAEVKKMDQFICNQCKQEAIEEDEQQQQQQQQPQPPPQQQQEKMKDEKQKYCLCEEDEYDENKYYVCCDLCERWFHGRCVGLLQKEAQELPEYQCPQCAPNSFLNSTNLKKLNKLELKSMMQILNVIAVRQNREIELKSDKYYSIKCYASSSFLNTRNVTSKILLSLQSKPTERVKFGSPYTLTAQLEPFDARLDYQLYSCIAFWKDREVELLDENGCETHDHLMSEFEYDQSEKEARATISSMFKFPDTNRFHIQCYFDTCSNRRCDRLDCSASNSTSSTKGGGAKGGSIKRKDYLTTTTIYVDDLVASAKIIEDLECNEWRFPWLITLTICLAILLLIMLLVNLFLCSSLTCTCTKTEISDKESVNDFDDYDPYKIDYSSPSPSLKH